MLCKQCGATDPAAFYPSIATYCREHWKERVRTNRQTNAEKYREYERQRASLPHRVQARAIYATTERGKAIIKAAHARYAKTPLAQAARKRYTVQHPNKRRAHVLAGNAIRDGRLVKQPCFVCGATEVEGHHPDYDQPLQVVWLCVAHHKEVHRMASLWAHGSVAEALDAA